MGILLNQLLKSYDNTPKKFVYFAMPKSIFEDFINNILSMWLFGFSYRCKLACYLCMYTGRFTHMTTDCEKISTIYCGHG